MKYAVELRANWRPLAAAFVGLGSGFSLTMYTTSIMAPHLLGEFGWSKSEFALVGSLSLLMIPILPLIGRLADVLGARRTALIGILSLPLCFVAFSMMKGDIRTYIGLFLAQSMLCVTTTATVYTRIVVQYVKSARGLALAVVASGPAFTGAIGGPLLNNFVEAHGWRAGYLALAVFSVVAGAITLLLMPPDRRADGRVEPVKARSIREDYPEIIANPAFWLMLAAMVLCNIALAISQTQLKLVLLDNGIAASGISIMISGFAVGVLLGRFVCGVALDRYPAHRVAALVMSLTSVGLLLLASHVADRPVQMLAVVLFGVSFGGEGDLIGYLVVRHFGVRVYSTVLGVMTAGTITASALGAALLSFTLKMTGGYTLFLAGSAVTVAVGSGLFLLLGRRGNGSADVPQRIAMGVG